MISIGWVSLATFLLGILVGVAGTLLGDPFKSLREEIANVDKTLTYQAHHIANPGSRGKDDLNEASDDLRKCASSLRAKKNQVRWHGLFSRLNLLPEKEEVGKASKYLIFSSNNVHRGNPSENLDKIDEIKDLLNLE